MTYKEFKESGARAFEVKDVETGRKEFILLSHHEPADWMKEAYETGRCEVAGITGKEGFIEEAVTYQWSVICMPAYVRGQHAGEPKWGAEHLSIRAKSEDEAMVRIGKIYRYRPPVTIKPIRFNDENPYEYQEEATDGKY